jgi:hypothetical protein
MGQLTKQIAGAKVAPKKLPEPKKTNANSIPSKDAKSK